MTMNFTMIEILLRIQKFLNSQVQNVTHQIKNIDRDLKVCFPQ